MKVGCGAGSHCALVGLSQPDGVVSFVRKTKSERNTETKIGQTPTNKYEEVVKYAVGFRNTITLGFRDRHPRSRCYQRGLQPLPAA